MCVCVLGVHGDGERSSETERKDRCGGEKRGGRKRGRDRNRGRDVIELTGSPHVNRLRLSQL